MSAYIRRVKSKSGKFRYYPILDGKHIGGGYSKKHQADTVLNNAITERIGGGPTNNKTLQEWYVKWIPQVATRVKKSTYESYEQAFRVHLLPAFGHKALSAISVADIEEWKAEQPEEGARTTNKTLTILGTSLQDAFLQGAVPTNIVRGIKKVKEEKKEMAFLTPTEARRLIGAESEISSVLATALLSGCRQGELMALQWGDVDLENGILYIRRSYRKGRITEPKTKAARRAVSIPPELCDILRPLKGEKDELCFNVDGKPWSVSTLVRGHFYPLLDNLRIRRIRWHDLRHTYAALMISPPVNCPMKWLQQQLGHTSISTTMDLYGHLLTDAGAGSIQKFGSLLFGENEPCEIEPPQDSCNEEECDSEEEK